MLNWKQIEALNTLDRKRDENYRLMFKGEDIGDGYAIVQDLRDDLYHFLFYHDGEIAEQKIYTNAVEAAMWMSFRFVLDNACDADTDDPKVEKRYSFCYSALEKLIERTKN